MLRKTAKDSTAVGAVCQSIVLHNLFSSKLTAYRVVGGSSPVFSPLCLPSQFPVRPTVHIMMMCYTFYVFLRDFSLLFLLQLRFSSIHRAARVQLVRLFILIVLRNFMFLQHFELLPHSSTFTLNLSSAFFYNMKLQKLGASLFLPLLLSMNRPHLKR